MIYTDKKTDRKIADRAAELSSAEMKFNPEEWVALMTSSGAFPLATVKGNYLIWLPPETRAECHVIQMAWDASAKTGEVADLKKRSNGILQTRNSYARWLRHGEWDVVCKTRTTLYGQTIVMLCATKPLEAVAEERKLLATRICQEGEGMQFSVPLAN
jgi:hypothetical protein